MWWPSASTYRLGDSFVQSFTQGLPEPFTTRENDSSLAFFFYVNRKGREALPEYNENVMNTNKKLEYAAPEVEMFDIKVESVICASGGEGGTGDPFDGEEG